MKPARKLLALLLVLCSLAGVLPAPALAVEPSEPAAEQTQTAPECGEHLEWALDSYGTLKVTGSGAMYDFALDEGKYAPWHLQGAAGKISKVVIGSGVTHVGNFAFYGCNELTQVELPESVKTIGQWAFGGCIRLKKVTIPATVTQISAHAFGYYQGESVGNITGLTISGYRNSAAQAYAAANSHIDFQELDAEPEKLSQPVVSSVSLSADGVVVKWNAVSGASQYRVLYKSDSGNWNSAGNTTGTSYTVHSLNSGKTYSFTVVCISQDGNKTVSDYDQKGKSIRYLSAPVVKSLTNATDGVQVKWDSVPGAVKYRVYYKVGTGRWESAGDTSATNMLVKKLKSGTRYTFTVRCVSSGGSFTSAYIPAGRSINYLSAPVVKSAVNVNGGVSVKWDKVPGAQKYRVFYRIGGGSWIKGGDTAKTSITVQGLKNNQKYTFTVRCISTDGTKYTSAYFAKGIASTYLQSPVLKSAVSVNGGVRVTWNRVAGMEQYRVFYKTGSGGWTKAGDTTGDRLLVSGLKSGTKYAFTVRGISRDGRRFTSGYDAGGVTTTYLEAPKLRDAKCQEDGILISWDKVPGASMYRVFYKNSSGNWRGIENTSRNYLLVTDLDQNAVHTFTVRCVSKDGARYVSGYNTKGVQTSGLYGSPAQYNFTSAYRNGSYYDKLMSVRLEGNARDNIVAIGLSQLGYTEGNNPSQTHGNAGGGKNYTEFGRWYYNHVDSGDVYYKGAWCSMFCSWCANEAGIPKNTVPRRALVEYMDDAFRAQGRYYTWNETQCGYGSKVIQKGDLIFYSASSGGRLSHIGIVTDVTYKNGRAYISTVEGNADDACRTRRWIMTKGSGGRIDSKHYIRGFACPAY